jgi:hypothetical protein
MGIFLTISGWLLTLISTIIAIHQYKEKEKYKSLYFSNKKQIINNNSTGYQAETMTVKNNETNN